MSVAEVIGLGAMNLDRLYRVDEIVTDGEQVVTESNDFPGGSAANTIYCLARLGVKTGFIGTVGSDKAGEILIDSLHSTGCDTSHIVVKSTSQSGMTICFSDKLGKRAIYVVPGANDLLNAKDIHIDYVNNTKFLHFSSFVNNDQFRLQLNLAESLKDTVKVTLAPGMLYACKGIEALSPLLTRSYVTFMNRDEVERLTGIDYKSGAKQCIALGCHIVVITLGSGIPIDNNRLIKCYIIDTEGEYEIESNYELSADLETLGAGDAFAAGFLFGLLKNRSTMECGILGDIMAHFTIHQKGSRAGIPTLTELSTAFSERSDCNL